MNYEILTEDTGLMPCVNDATAGVGRIPDERKIFQDLFKFKKIDYYICPKCVYVIDAGKYYILFKDLNLLNRTKKHIFFETVGGEKILVTKQNFSIKCYFKKEPNCPDAWVKEYMRKPKGKP